MSRTWKGIIHIEGRVTEDGRLTPRNALTFPTEPIPLMRRVSDLHTVPTAIGTVDRIARTSDGFLEASGTVFEGREWEGELPVAIDLRDVVYDSAAPERLVVVSGKIASVHVTDGPPFPACVIRMTEDEPEVVEPPLTINVLLTKQGVNMGDHGQDVTVAVQVDPEETVRHLVERTLSETTGWGTRTQTAPKDEWYLTLRVPQARAVEPEGSAF